MIFIQNKYTRIYYSIINNANQLNRKKLKRNHPEYIYYEKHHIIPKCLSGDNSKTNLVLLTAREHFICHWLLTKMIDGSFQQKMFFALRYMNNSSKIHIRYNTKITSRVFANLRGKLIMSDDQKQKISSTMKGRKLSESHKHNLSLSSPRISRPQLVETKIKISNTSKGKKQSEETKRKISIAKKGQGLGKSSNRKGVILSAATKEKMSIAALKRKKAA